MLMFQSAARTAAGVAGLALLLTGCGGDESTDLSVTSTCGSGVVVPVNTGNAGEVQVCMQEVRNDGLVTATGLQYRFSLAPGLTLVSSWCLGPDGIPCDAPGAAGGRLPDLLPGQQALVALELQSTPTANDVYWNQFSVTASNEEQYANNTLEFYVVARSTDLSATLTTPTSVPAGTEFDAVLRIVNKGPVDVLAKEPWLWLPDQTALFSRTAVDGSGQPAFPVSGRTYSGWPISAGAVLTFTYRVVVADGARGRLRFSAEVPPIGDPDRSDNYPESFVEVIAP